MKTPVAAAALVSLLLTSSPAHAYLGPGLGVGTLAVIFGIFGSILIALFAVVWYPLRRRLRRSRPTAASSPPDDSRR